MNSLNTILEFLPDYAKDTKLNMESLLSAQAAIGLSDDCRLLTMLTCAYCTKSEKLVAALENDFKSALSEQAMNAAKTAASLMAMNNIYYKFTHFAQDPEISHLPVKLRMSMLRNSGIAQGDFEALALAASIINGCEICVTSHITALTKHEFSKEAVQSIARIAAVINALAQVLFMERQQAK